MFSGRFDMNLFCCEHIRIKFHTDVFIDLQSFDFWTGSTRFLLDHVQQMNLNTKFQYSEIRNNRGSVLFIFFFFLLCKTLEVYLLTLSLSCLRSSTSPVSTTSPYLDQPLLPIFQLILTTNRSSLRFRKLLILK